MRKTREESEKTRLALLDSAALVFARDGYDAARLEDIGREAGVTRGAVYWHFKNKGAIFDEIIRRENEGLRRLIDKALSSFDSPFRQLRALLEAVVDNFYDNATFRRQIVMTWYRLGASQYEGVMSGKSAFVRNFLGLLEGLLRGSRKRGEIAAGCDPRLEAYHLSCLINGFYRLYHVAPNRGRDKELTRRLFRRYLDALKEAR